MSPNLKLSLILSGLFFQTTGGLAQSSGNFVPVGSMAVPRSGHTSTLLPDGRVLITGGYSVSMLTGPMLTGAEIYDPSTGNFTATGSMHIARAWHSATLLKNGRVLLIGGGEVAEAAEIYNPATGTFDLTGKPHDPQRGHTATLLKDGKVLIAGGFWQWTGGRRAELYDPETGLFEALGYAGGSGSQSALLPDGRVLIAGGLNQPTASLYDPKLGGFSPSQPLSTYPWGSDAGFGIEGHRTSSLPNGKVLVTGGGEDWYDGLVMSYSELYDPLTNSFDATGKMNYARAAHTATVLPGGRVLLAGGCCTSASSQTAELFDFTSGSFRATGKLTFVRGMHTGTLLNDGTVLITGGGFINVMTTADKPSRTAELYFPPLLPVSSATLSTPLASGSLASLFGPRLGDGPAISVNIRDSAGVDRFAQLLSVSPSQIDFEVPAGLASGEAVLEIVNTSSPTRSVRAPIRSVAPGLFSRDNGVAAAYTVPGYLILFGTGIRNRSSVENVQCTIGGVDVPVEYAGPQGDVPGLDQVNIRLGPVFKGNGDGRLVLTVDGQQANPVLIPAQL